jgi:hypothetical protein
MLTLALKLGQKLIDDSSDSIGIGNGFQFLHQLSERNAGIHHYRLHARNRGDRLIQAHSVKNAKYRFANLIAAAGCPT